MRKIILISLAVFFATTLLPQVPNGTYVPITDMAKRLQFAKFVFSDNKVKIYLGMNGISLGVANEYSYSMNGNTLSIKEGTTSVEYLTYDKTKDQIIYSMDASYELLGQFGTMLGQANDRKVDSKGIADAFKQLGIEPPVWGKEGTAYELPATVKLQAPQEECALKIVAAGCEYTVKWKSVKYAVKYKIEWTFYGYDGLLKDKGTDWTENTKWTRTLLDDRGTVKIKIFAADSQRESQKALEITVEVMKEEGKGKLIFLTHGLEDSRACFEKTVNRLDNYNNYYDLGYVTMRTIKGTPVVSSDVTCVSLIHLINEMTSKGINILVRTEFSAGNLSFACQLKEMGEMVGKFNGHNADVVFIGHSMGGLASINYAIDYADSCKTKKVKIITIDTPYYPNNYAKLVWDGNSPGLTSLVSQILSNQVRGEAHRDLSGFREDGKIVITTTEGAVDSPLYKLKNKWNNYTGGAKLYSISVSMYGEFESRYMKIGDGVVDIYSQKGGDKKAEWNNVKRQNIIFGIGKSNLEENTFGGINDRNNPYYHLNTPVLPEVIKKICDIIECDNVEE